MFLFPIDCGVVAADHQHVWKRWRSSGMVLHWDTKGERFLCCSRHFCNYIGDMQGSPSWGVEFWEICSFYAWLWLCILLIVMIYAVIAKRIWTLSTLTGSTQRTVLRFSVYPLILIVCWGFNTYWNLAFKPGDGGMLQCALSLSPCYRWILFQDLWQRFLLLKDF
jgi:hypothetical protein